MKVHIVALIFLDVALLAFSSTCWSEEFFHWRDKEGIAHYGSTPPQGIKATKVKIYGGSPSRSFANSRSLAKSRQQAIAVSNNPQPQETAQPDLQREQEAQCVAERKRLRILKANRPIRMKQTDGSLKYLSREEIAREIQQSNNYLNDACS